MSFEIFFFKEILYVVGLISQNNRSLFQKTMLFLLLYHI
ncbi:hypothetical protein SK667_1810 [Streptococcus mitis]|nr:hypothetical protein SK667_1810 [Streptococcus mitis]